MTREQAFEAFWGAYPNKKGKGDARKAFESAIKKTSIEKMLDAITRYVAHKPDWQAYKYPGPWLRSERWDDEWEPQQARPSFQSSAQKHQSREEYLRAELARSERSFSR